MQSGQFMCVGLMAGAVVCAGAERCPAQETRYRLEIYEAPAGAESVFPGDMTEGGLIVGQTGSDEYDPLAQPLILLGARQRLLPIPTDSLNFLLGVGSPETIVGASSNLPAAWVRGRPRILKPANGFPNGAAYDANRAGVICGEVYQDFTGRQWPVVWRDADAVGRILPGIGDAKQGAAFAVNEQNQIAGVLLNLGGLNFGAVRWDNPVERPKVLGALPGAVNSEALALNEVGDAAGRSSFADNSVRAMLYLEATQSVVDVGTLGGTYAIANDVNKVGQVVGFSNEVEFGAARGFIWFEGVMLDLNDLVAEANGEYDHIADAKAIDDQGRIAVRVQVQTERGPAQRIGMLVPVR